jgi:[ribosomal protein S5]-alanine N-acetyltransferase
MNPTPNLRLVEIQADGTIGENSLPLPAAICDVLPAMVRLYATEGYSPPWIGYLALEGSRCVGTCAFKSPPREGRVEIAYFTLPEFEGQGRGTEMARQLLQRARSADPRVQVIAQTLPMENASTSILRRLQFECVGTVEHPEDGPVWEWHHRPEQAT